MSNGKFIQPPGGPPPGMAPQGPPGMAPPGPPPQANVNVNPQDLDDVMCECGNYTFVDVVLMKEIPAILSPTGQAGLVPQKVIACYACGKVPDQIAKQLAGTWFKRPPGEETDPEAGIVSTSLPELEKIELAEDGD